MCRAPVSSLLNLNRPRLVVSATAAWVTPFMFITVFSILATHDAHVIPKISISTWPSPVPGSSITSDGKPSSDIEVAISSGVTRRESYLISAFAASSATRMLSTPIYNVSILIYVYCEKE